MPEARYEIIRQLACGGMAEVLLARQNADDGTNRLVVLKRVLAHLSQNDGFLKMFAHEARIASQLRHPNIVQVLEVGEHEGLPVIVMERLEGADLLRLLQQCVTRRQSLGTAVSMAILAGAARGLGYAHRARSSDGRALRLIHRDISPHNVFITRDGGVKLLDFGIAKSAAHVGLTSTGQVKGKISYMSPEQIRSLPIDARSDLWSLGVVLWETLAGEKLFTRDNDAATLHAILHDPIPPLNRREAPGLDDLIARVLQRDSAARIGTAEEIASALEAMLEGMRAGPSPRLVAQRVASLVPAISPEFDLARPSAAPSHEVVTLAVGAGGPAPAKRPPPRGTPVAPPPPAHNRYSQAHGSAHDDDVAVDDEPTQMDMPTASVPPPDDEATRAVSLPPPSEEETIERAPSRPSPMPATPPPMPMARPAPVAPAPPPRASHPPRPPASVGPARPPANPRSRVSTVMGTGTTPPLPGHPAMLSDEADPPTAQLARPATMPPPRAAAPMPMPLGPVPTLVSAAPVASPMGPPDDPFGPVPNQGPGPSSLAPPLNAIRPGTPSPFSNNPLAGFAARSPDTFVAAEIARPAPPPAATARTARWLVAAGSLVLAATVGVVATQRMRTAPPSAPMAASEPMPVVHVPETAPPAPAPQPAAEPPPVAAAEPAPAPQPVAEPAPVAVAAPEPVAAPAPAPVAVAAPAPAAVAVAAPAPVAAPRPRVAVAPRTVPTPAAPRTVPTPAAAPAPTPITRVASAPSRTGGLVDPFDLPSTPAARTPAPRAPTPRPAPVVAAPTPRPTVVAAPRANDPFNNVYSDPTQRRPTPRPRVQAPPSAHTGAIITEF